MSDAPKFTIHTYRDEWGDWRWRIVSKNGKVVASGEGYKRRGMVLKTLYSLIEAIKRGDIEFISNYPVNE